MRLIGVKSNRWQMQLQMGLTVKQWPEAEADALRWDGESHRSPRAGPSACI